uniref:Uncharacterized protein n=1 Tax=Salix viminalis TaxID=40686 RepID=A0A6N2KYN6_SALVM
MPRKVTLVVTNNAALPYIIISSYFYNCSRFFFTIFTR